jgi:DNA invertase Pin-like site-specific DNA recombinase
VTDEIADAGESASSLDRPGMARVLALVKARKVEAVLIAKLDRITRSVRDLADLLDTFSRHHCALVSAGESLNTETAAGRMIVRIMAVISEWEREAIGERTRDALSAKRSRGERTSRHAPLGFQLTPDGRLEPHDVERGQLRVIAECRAAGFTWGGTAHELARLGYLTRAGRPWTWGNVRSAHTTAQRLGTLDRQPA